MISRAKDIIEEVSKLEKKVNNTILPPELKERLLDEISRLTLISENIGYSQEFDRIFHYVEWIANLPWSKRSDDILDLDYAKKVLDKNHYGLIDIKERILEYLAVLKLRKENQIGVEKGIMKFISKACEAGLEDTTGKSPWSFMRAPILCFVGLAGTGKTTIAYSIAEAMGRKLERVPFGGIGDPLYLRGQSRVYPDSEPGQIIKAIRRAGTKNPVILLDEIDRVVDQSRSTIMGVLVELLDPEQNMAYTDHFIDYSFDLSEVLFIATANNTTNISTAVLDRLEPMQMPSYTDEEKIKIGREFVLPKIMEEAGLTKDNLEITEGIWPMIVRPLGYDAGMRTLERTINGICRKVAKLIVERKGKRFVINKENVKEFLPNW